MTAGEHQHHEKAWMVLGQLLLAVAALFSLPLGARDGGGVSSILPPLRSTLSGADAASAASDRRRVDDELIATASVRHTVRRPVRRRPRQRPAPAWRPWTEPARPSASTSPRQSRAPPLAS
jgi:hypothetical protein